MNYIAVSISEAEEFFLDFLTQKVKVISMLRFCEMLELSGTYTSTYLPKSLLSLIFLHGSMEKNYTSDEIEYLQCSCDQAFFCSCNEAFLSVVFVEIDTHEDNRDLIACAIIKIMFKAFRSNILLCFKHRKEIALGMVLEASNIKYSLSCWFSSLNISNLVELCVNCGGNLEEIEYEIQRSSHNPYDEKNFDFCLFDYDYLNALNDIASAYSVDLSAEINRCLNTHSQFATSYHPSTRSKYIADALRFIGIDEASSYDYLEKATDFERISSNNVINTDETELDTDIEVMKSIPKEAFVDAEKILEYFNRKDD